MRLEDEPTEDEPSPPEQIRLLTTDPEFRRAALHFARRTVRRFGLPQSAAEDVCQSALLKLVKYSENVGTRKIEDPYAYLLTVVRNEAHRLLEGKELTLHRARNEPAEIIQFDEAVETKSARDAFEDVRHVESVILMKELVRLLDGAERELLKLWLVGYSSREIAEEMRSRGVSISHVTVSRNINSIVEKLRKLVFGESRTDSGG